MISLVIDIGKLYGKFYTQFTVWESHFSCQESMSEYKQESCYHNESLECTLSPPHTHIKYFINCDTLFGTNYLGHSSQPIKTYCVKARELRSITSRCVTECVTNCIAQNRHLNRKEGQKWRRRWMGDIPHPWNLKQWENGKLGKMQPVKCNTRSVRVPKHYCLTQTLIISNIHLFLSSLNMHLIYLNILKWNNFAFPNFSGYICQEHLSTLPNFSWLLFHLQ